MKRTLLVTGTALVLGLFTAGCASAPGGSAGSRQTMIQVENNNSLLVDVEVLSRGQDYNLGQVETTNTETFAIPRTADPLDLQIRVDPVGSPETYVSHEITFAPGDLIVVEVESDLSLTTVRTM